MNQKKMNKLFLRHKNKNNTNNKIIIKNFK